MTPNRIWQATILSLSIFVAGCVSIPDGVTPVKNFATDRYLGTWYEIARMDNRFERDLQQVTATYSLRDDGGIEVVNRGVNDKTGKSDEAIGKAFAVGEPDVAHLKVSFFGPFYGSYVVFHLDPEYRFAFVTGNDRDFLWLLSRTPSVEESVKTLFVEKATALGFNLDNVVWVKH